MLIVNRHDYKGTSGKNVKGQGHGFKVMQGHGYKVTTKKTNTNGQTIGDFLH